MAIGARGLPPDYPARVPSQWDEIRWGQSLSGNVPRGGRDDCADRAGLPRLPIVTTVWSISRRHSTRRNGAGILGETRRSRNSIRLSPASRRLASGARWHPSAIHGSR